MAYLMLCCTAEHYGFVLADNPHDKAPLPTSAFSHAIAAYMEQQGSSGGHRYLHCNGIPSWQLLQELRSCVASTAEKKQSWHLAAAGMRISIAGDMRVSRFLSEHTITDVTWLSVTATGLKEISWHIRDTSWAQSVTNGLQCIHAAKQWRCTKVMHCLISHAANNRDFLRASAGLKYQIFSSEQYEQ